MTGRTAAAALAFAAVLATSAASRAGTIVFDLTGSTEEVRLPVAFVGAQGPFEAPLAPGSSLSLAFDEGGGGVTIAASHLAVHHDMPLGSLGSLTTDTVGELTGGAGRVEASFSQWLEPASYSVTGTFECSGEICALGGWAEGVPLPYSELLHRTGIEIQTPTDLGLWGGANPDALFDPYTGTYSYLPLDGSFSGAVDAAGESGASLRLRGQRVPEPAALASLGASLLLLSLGRRASRKIRRRPRL